jgi:hypothetical protein
MKVAIYNHPHVCRTHHYDMLEASNEFEFLKLICIKGLRGTEQYVEIVRSCDRVS